MTEIKQGWWHHRRTGAIVDVVRVEPDLIYYYRLHPNTLEWIGRGTAMLRHKFAKTYERKAKIWQERKPRK